MKNERETEMVRSTGEKDEKPGASSISRALRFLALLFWVMPIRREADRERSFDIKVSYGMLGLALVLYLLYSKPYFPPGTFPELSQLTVVEGVLVRHPSRRDGRYTNEPVGIRTLNGDVFKQCSTLGVRCLVGPDEPNDWQSYVGKPARIWFWGEWIIQFEIDGRIPYKLSYAKRRDGFTSLPFAFWFGLMVGTYLIFRLIQRYGRAAFNECV